MAGESFRVQAGIPGFVGAVVGQQDIVWEGAFGFRDIEQRLPAETGTAFQFDGVTQLVTVSLVLRCVEDGQVSLDDPIGRFAPGAPEADATVREILTHAAGASSVVRYVAPAPEPRLYTCAWARAAGRRWGPSSPGPMPFAGRPRSRSFRKPSPLAIGYGSAMLPARGVSDPARSRCP